MEGCRLIVIQAPTAGITTAARRLPLVVPLTIVNTSMGSPLSIVNRDHLPIARQNFGKIYVMEWSMERIIAHAHGENSSLPGKDN